MLLKVLMGFHNSFHMHQHTHIGKKKSNNNISNNNNNNKNKIIKQQYNSRAEYLVRCMHLLRIKRQLQNYFSKIIYDSKAVCFSGSISLTFGG